MISKLNIWRIYMACVFVAALAVGAWVDDSVGKWTCFIVGTMTGTTLQLSFTHRRS